MWNSEILCDNSIFYPGWTKFRKIAGMEGGGQKIQTLFTVEWYNGADFHRLTRLAAETGCLRDMTKSVLNT